MAAVVTLDEPGPYDVDQNFRVAHIGELYRPSAGTLSGVPQQTRPPVGDPIRLPQWTPSPRESDDLELLTMGVLAPMDGFVVPTDGKPTITLAVDSETAASAVTAGSVQLLDPEGVLLGRLDVEATYQADRGQTGLAGPVRDSRPREFGPFRRFHLTPAAAAASYDPGAALGVVVRRPLNAADLDTIGMAADGRDVVLLAFAGTGSPCGVTAPALVRTTLAAAALLPRATTVAVAVARHGDPTTDHWLEQIVATAYAGDVLLLRPREGASPATIAAIVERDQPRRDRRGLVVFFTGLSGSGKSTLARALTDHLLETGERTVTSLDGDVVRHLLSKGLGFSREDRETNIIRIGFVAAEISRHGGTAICSPIAPFAATRARVRELVEDAGGGLVLVHVATPLKECERRDRKGLYRRARAGEIPEFTGISSPYEIPVDADLTIDTSGRTVADCLEEIIGHLSNEGWLTAPSDGE